MLVVWNVALGIAIVVMIVAAGRGLVANWNRLQEELGGAAEAVEASPGDVEPAPVEDDAAAAPEMPAPPMATVTTHRPETGSGPIVATHPAMGAEFAITMYPTADQTPSYLRRVADEAFASIDELEARISTWIAGSETSRVNRLAAEEPVRVSPETFELLQTAREIHDATGGAFDVTVGPVLELWGFYRTAGRLPGDDELAAALGRVGMEKVTLDAEARTVELAREGMRIDFGGIGKGLGVDAAAAVLERYGVESALLHGGTSTVLVVGSPPDRDAWVVALRDPTSPEGERVTGQVDIREGSISTSATGDKGLLVEGVRYGHIVNPDTGWPVDDVVVRSTALAPTGVRSDALSTAFFVMGPAGTERYCAAHPDVRAILLLRRDGGELREQRYGRWPA
jgi:thiamine biosynthesis lipoprotein